MNSIIYNYFLANKNNDFQSGEPDYKLMADFKALINDRLYYQFIVDSNNGGYFFEHSLHLYGFMGKDFFHDIQTVNLLLQKEYGDIAKSLISFGQDLFGDQYCFDTNLHSVVMFQSETGERRIIATDFGDWLRIVDEDLPYYTGINLAKDWKQTNSLEYGKRLSPKKPFIMGGDFLTENLYAGSFPEFISAYANIARQVYNLPDGTPVNLVITNDKP